MSSVCMFTWNSVIRRKLKQNIQDYLLSIRVLDIMEMILGVSFKASSIFRGSYGTALEKIVSSLKSNCQIKLSWSKSLIHTILLYRTDIKSLSKNKMTQKLNIIAKKSTIFDCTCGHFCVSN